MHAAFTFTSPPPVPFLQSIHPGSPLLAPALYSRKSYGDSSASTAELVGPVEIGRSMLLPAGARAEANSSGNGSVMASAGAGAGAGEVGRSSIGSRAGANGSGNGNANASGNGENGNSATIEGVDSEEPVEIRVHM